MFNNQSFANVLRKLLISSIFGQITCDPRSSGLAAVKVAQEYFQFTEVWSSLMLIDTLFVVCVVGQTIQGEHIAT